MSLRAVLDAFLIAAAYFLALGLRVLDPGIVQRREFLLTLLAVTPLVILVHLAGNVALGVYRNDPVTTKKLARASAMAVGVLLGLLALGRQFNVVVPISTVLSGGIVAFLLMASVRYLLKLVYLRRNSA